MHNRDHPQLLRSGLIQNRKRETLDESPSDRSRKEGSSFGMKNDLRQRALHLPDEISTKAAGPCLIKSR